MASGSRVIPSSATMPNLHIRGVPPEIHERLKAQAAAEGRSVNDYLVRVLAERSARPTTQEWLGSIAAFADGVRTLAPGEAAELVREGRRERDAQIDGWT